VVKRTKHEHPHVIFYSLQLISSRWVEVCSSFILYFILTYFSSFQTSISCWIRNADSTCKKMQISKIKVSGTSVLFISCKLHMKLQEKSVRAFPLWRKVFRWMWTVIQHTISLTLSLSFSLFLLSASFYLISIFIFLSLLPAFSFILFYFLCFFSSLLSITSLLYVFL
jgi:hypothetical protein